LELADIIRCHGPKYRERFGQRMPENHRRALDAIERCRTSDNGGHTAAPTASMCISVTTVAITDHALNAAEPTRRRGLMANANGSCPSRIS
jgi:hypothetical protein